MGLFDEADRVFVQGRPADLDAGRRAKPIKDPMAAAVAAPWVVDHEGILVAPFVARKPQCWQAYFLFSGRAAFTGVWRFAARFAATGLRRASTADRFLATGLAVLTVLLAGGLGAAGSGALRGSGIGERWTSVNRV